MKKSIAIAVLASVVVLAWWVNSVHPSREITPIGPLRLPDSASIASDDAMDSAAHIDERTFSMNGEGMTLVLTR